MFKTIKVFIKKLAVKVFISVLKIVYMIIFILIIQKYMPSNGQLFFGFKYPFVEYFNFKTFSCVL